MEKFIMLLVPCLFDALSQNYVIKYGKYRKMVLKIDAFSFDALNRNYVIKHDGRNSTKW